MASAPKRPNHRTQVKKAESRKKPAATTPPTSGLLSLANRGLWASRKPRNTPATGIARVSGIPIRYAFVEATALNARGAATMTRRCTSLMATIDAVSNRDQAALIAFVSVLPTRLPKSVRRVYSTRRAESRR